MKIESYAHGQMTIDGEVYQKDLILFPDRVIPGWWRKEGHRVDLEDLALIVKAKPQLLIIGTGSAGCMQVPPDVSHALKKEGIEVIDSNTDRAAEIFNEQNQAGRKVAGAFHLTC